MIIQTQSCRKIFHLKKPQLGIVAHTCHLSSQEAKARVDSVEPGLQSELQATLKSQTDLQLQLGAKAWAGTHKALGSSPSSEKKELYLFKYNMLSNKGKPHCSTEM